MRIIAVLIILATMGSIATSQTLETSKISNPPGVAVSAADGVPIAYEAHGSGATSLVFIHGWCSNRSFWREQLGVMANNYRVIAIDLPGHGDSGRTRQEWSIASFANDVISVIEALDLNFEGSMTMFMPHMFSPDTAPELVKWATENSLKADHGMAVAVMRCVSELDEKELLSSVAVPVRCIYAAPKDTSKSSRSFVETNGKYADFNAVFVEGVGHFLHLEDPKSVNQHLEVFLKEIEERAAAK